MQVEPWGRAGRPLQIVVMGPSGSGKSTVGAALAAMLGVEFIDGDDHHSDASVEKMRSGRPLTDGDRASWLEELAKILGSAVLSDRGVVLACSALRRVYRDTLRSMTPPHRVIFVELVTPESVLGDRLRGREHFMPASLLESQMEILEPLEADETGVRVPSTGDVHAVATAAVAAIRECG